MYRSAAKRGNTAFHAVAFAKLRIGTRPEEPVDNPTAVEVDPEYIRALQ